ncbi:LytR family transcriptional regulator, partial [Streptomyces olivaceus]
MDAQGRGRADDVDPADQWVLNPHTGEYELRLPSSAPQSPAPQPPVPGPRRGAPRSPGAPGDGDRRDTAGTARRRTAAPGREGPPQRRRRTPEEPVPGRR